MSLGNYWPKADAVNACIKNEAETADVSVLLAVHQPTPLAHRAESTGEAILKGEQDLLDAFLTDNVPGGALLVPITGPSGSGKSHTIRWLDAQLSRSRKRDQFHIIRIPKSASLRKVVELILEPLRNDPRYASARQDLTRAVAEVNVKNAVVTFRAHLENELSACSEQMLAILKEHPEKRHLRYLVGHAKNLPNLFSDAALAEHFIKNVLSRIVARALQGWSSEKEEEREHENPQFRTDDLILPTDVDISKAAQIVHSYYVTNIARVDADRLQPVVDLLNDAIDPAIKNVFQLEQSTGGITLQDIILSVRKLLFEDGKDLVLLVEDFAALAGIQEVLLNVCIYEGEYDGQKVRATMRTALAVTDGYLSFRQTILTRAGGEWVVGGQTQNDNEIKAEIIDMVGAYLNAARWGRDELGRRFRQLGAEDSLTNWLPIWRDENLDDAESEALAAFGSNSSDVPLFPFNETAIRTLVDQHLTEGDRLKLNPRRVINFILRDTLLMRNNFEAGSFPPAKFQECRPNAAILNWVQQAHQPPSVIPRLSTLLALWGGNPTDIDEIFHMPPGIFKAFGMPTPAEIDNVPEPPKLTLSSLEEKPPDREEKVGEDPGVAELRDKLDRWSGGIMLEQRDANQLRKVLMSMVQDSMNWPALRMRSNDLTPQAIHIHQMRGNPVTRDKLILCDDARDESGSIRSGLLAAYRHVEVHKKKWTYPEADEDYVASVALVDRLVMQLEEKNVRDAKSRAAVLGRALVTQARIVGLEPAVRPTKADKILQALFSNADPIDQPAFDDRWDRLRANALAEIGNNTGRVALQKELLNNVACFQGSGTTPQAIDIVRLADALPDEEAAENGLTLIDAEFAAFIRPLSDTRLWGQITSCTQKLEHFNAQIGDYVDKGFDKHAFVDDLQEIVRLLLAIGISTNFKVPLKTFESQVTEFRTSAIMDLMEKVKIIVDADRDQIPKVLNALGALDLGLITHILEFHQTATEFIASAERNIDREESDREKANPEKVGREIAELLFSLTGNQPGAEAAQ